MSVRDRFLPPARTKPKGPKPVRYTWLLPAIVVFAIVVLIVAVVWAAAHGTLFEIPTTRPSRS